MSQFISLTILCIIVSGAIIHFGIEIPYVSPWIGQLPGDLAIHKGELTLYIPLATSLAVSLVLSFLGSFFNSSK